MGLASLLALNVPENRRGWYAMIPQLGAPIGLIVASGLFAYFVATLSAADFLELGLALSVLRGFRDQRRGVVCAPADRDDARIRAAVQQSRPQARAGADHGKEQWRSIIIGAFAPLASFALFHMVTVFPLSWIFLFTREVPSQLPADRVHCRFLRDRRDHRLGLAGRPLWPADAARASAPRRSRCSAVSRRNCSMRDNIGELMYMIIGFILLGLSFGQSSGAVAANFSRSVALYRIGADVRPCLAVRRGLRAARRAAAGEQAGPARGRRISAVGRSADAAGARDQQGTGQPQLMRLPLRFAYVFTWRLERERTPAGQVSACFSVSQNFPVFSPAKYENCHGQFASTRRAQTDSLRSFPLLFMLASQVNAQTSAQIRSGRRLRAVRHASGGQRLSLVERHCRDRNTGRTAPTIRSTRRLMRMPRRLR